MQSKVKQIKINYSKLSCDKDTQLLLYKTENAKKAYQKLRPFTDPDILNQIRSFYKTDCVWSSEALEGNTISQGETQIMIEEGVTVDGHPINDILRTTGHAEAFDEAFNMINNKAITCADIKKLHNLIIGRVQPTIAGHYKTKPNFITGSEYTTIPPEQIPEEMERLDNWLKERTDKENPILLAAETHRKLVYIHPFMDGNGRVARLAMNTILIQNGYLPIGISPYMKRDYNSALELGRQGNMDAFYRFIAEAEYETEKDFCRYMNIEIPTVSKETINESVAELTKLTTPEIPDSDTPSKKDTYDAI